MTPATGLPGGSRRRRVAIVTSHPIQYHAPWFRGLADRCELRVFFAHRQSPLDQAKAGYGVAFDWDTDVLGGYDHEFLDNVAADPNVYEFWGCDTPGLAARLRDGRYDAVVVTGWYLKSHWQAVWASRRLRIPVLVRGDSQLGTPRPMTKRLAKALAYRLMLRQFDGFLSVGSRNREYLRHFGVPADRIAFVPHFVDGELFAIRSRLATGERMRLREQLGLRADHAAALFVGRLVEFKRPMDLLYAVARLQRDGERFQAVFAGAGPLEPTLRATAERLGVRLSILGFRNQSELPCVYAAADMLVLPSDARETWGLVVNEAQSCGLPAVISDAVGCAPDLIDPGRTGYVYTCADVAALAEAMRNARELGNAPELADHLRAKTTEYSCERAVEGTLAAIEQTIARRR